jgi:DNA-binding response OmpR family regulator
MVSILLLVNDKTLQQELYELAYRYTSMIYHASDGLVGERLYLEHSPTLIICNHELERLDGLSLISKIRQYDSDTKVIFLSYSQKQEDLLRAIELNLVSYILKPLRSFETLRQKLDMVAGELMHRGDIYLQGGFIWNRYKQALYKDLEKIELTTSEKALLEYLIEHANYPCSYESIHYAVFSKDDYSQDAISSLVKRLRQKSSKDIIQTIYKIGYQIEV